MYYNKALDIVSKMKGLEFPINEGVFNALVYVHAISGNIEDAFKIISFMKDAEVKPSPETYAQLAHGFAKTGDILNMLKILKNTKQSTSNIMKLVKTLSLSGYGTHILSVLTSLNPLVEGNESVITNTTIELIHAGYASDAYTIVDHVFADPQAIDIQKQLAMCFLKETISSNMPTDTILKFANDLSEAKHVKNALVQTAELALHLGNENLALPIFKAMKEKGIPIRPHYYWPLLLKAREIDGESSIYSLIRHMMDLNVKLDIETLNGYVFPYITTADPVITVKKMESNGVPLHYIFTPLIVFLLHVNKLKKTVYLCDEYDMKIKYQYIVKPLVSGYKITKDIDSCIYLLIQFSKEGHAFVKQFLTELANRNNLDDEDAKNIIKFLHAMQLNKVSVPHSDMNGIRHAVNNANFQTQENKKETILTLLNNLDIQYSAQENCRNMNIQQLECQAIELKSKQLNMRGALRRLLQLLCKENNLEKAEQIKQEFNANNFKWTPGMRAHLFNLYVKNNMLDKAKSELFEIQDNFSDFKIDNFKIIEFATKLVKNNNLDAAITLIKEWKQVNNKIDATGNCWHLLSEIAKSSDFHYAEKMLNLLVLKGYCRVSNTALGPLVEQHLLRNDIKSAIDVFKKCVEVYKLTPLKQKIVSALIKEIETSPEQHIEDTLKEIYDLILRVNGKAVAIKILIVALAQHNRVKDLQEILKGENVPMSKVAIQLKHLSDDNKILKSSLTILEACRNIHRTDIEPICNLILSIYIKSEDCEHAIDLWRKMEEANVKPSYRFQESFIQFLECHKFQIPPDIQIDKNQTSNELQGKYV